MKELSEHTCYKYCINKSLICVNLNKEELNILCKNKRVLNYKKREVIFREGEHIDEFLHLKEGLIKLSKTITSNREQIISIEQPKNYDGLFSVFYSPVCKYSITALEDSSVCLFNINAIRKMIKQNGSLSLVMLEKASRNFDDIIKRRFDLSYKRTRGRVACIILFFAENIYHNNIFYLSVSRKEIAELIDMTAENVTRILSEFRKDNIIKVKRRKIEILNKSLLKKISELG